MRELAVVESYLPLIVVLLPVVGAFLLYIVSSISKELRNFTLVALNCTVLILVASMFPVLRNGRIFFELGALLDYGIHFYVDGTSLIFAFLISLIWLIASFYALDYMEGEANQVRFFSFLTVTLGGALGTVLAGDLFTLFIFFELMSLSSYVLVVHKEDQEALSAGKKYLFMAIGGGLVLLLGIFLIFFYAGTLNIVFLMSYLEPLGWSKYIIAACFIIGFGVKAGMLPLHIWLPEAHPVAPSPASALLSGIMIKVGVYGILRTTAILFSPSFFQLEMGLVDWSVAGNLGYFILIMGFITMFAGASLAIFQRNMKKILAYSSISQIGFILVGIGLSTYMGTRGGLGFEAGIYHLVNHAFFKSSLFLIAGLIYVRAHHELDIYKLGGLYKRMPITTIAFIIGMFGIIGMPGFNGFVSKTLLHEALLEAYRFQGDKILYYGEKIFKLTSAMTVAYFTKMLVAFFSPPNKEMKDLSEDSIAMKFCFGILSVGIILLGLFPGVLMDTFIIPATVDYTFTPSGIMNQINIFSSKHIEASLLAILAGLAIYLIFFTSRLIDLKLPRKISLEYFLYRPIYYMVIFSSDFFTTIFDRTQDRPVSNNLLLSLSQNFTSVLDRGEAHIGDGPQGSHTPKPMPLLPEEEKGATIETLGFTELLLYVTRNRFRSRFDGIKLDVKNLDFGLFLLIILLLLIFVLFFPQIYSL